MDLGFKNLAGNKKSDASDSDFGADFGCYLGQVDRIRHKSVVFQK
jgi:hypothetical protein